MTPVDILLAVLATGVWSGAFVATDTALREAPPILFAALRFCVSALALPFLPRPRVSWRALLVLGLTIGVGQHVGIFFGMATGVTPGMAALLAHTQSFFTLALAWGLMGEALTMRKLCGFVAALCGLVLLMAERGTPMPPLAIAIVLGGALAGGLGNFVLRRIGGADPIGVAAWLSAVAAPLLLALSIAVEGMEPLRAILSGPSPGFVVATAYSGILSGLVAYAIWARLFGRYEAHRIAPFMLMVPVGAIALSALFLGERPGLWRLGAAAAILIGLGLNLVPARQRR
jgi:O-acetylserine/cysteine efflux transporter